MASDEELAPSPAPSSKGEEQGAGTDEVGSSQESDVGATKERPSSSVPTDGFGRREAKRMARNPCRYLLAGLAISFALSAIAMTVGDFSVAIDNAGWWSRGTEISDRQTQIQLARWNKEYLFYGGPEAWIELQSNVQDGWEVDGDATDDRRLSVESSHLMETNEIIASRRSKPFEGASRGAGISLPQIPHRLLQDQPSLEGCDISFYTAEELTSEARLWPVWKTTSKKYDIMDAEVIRDLCVAEANTQRALEDNDLCFGCDEGCLPPYSPILFARLTLGLTVDVGCDELAEAWDASKDRIESEWVECVKDIKESYDVTTDEALPDSCPLGFNPAFVQDNFDVAEWKTFTSSIFATRGVDYGDVLNLYYERDKYDRGSSRIQGSYDTQYEDFVLIYSDTVLGSDMALAMGSAVVTVLAILIHTRSPFLTVIGLLQIILTFPLSYFVYTFIARLEFFPFLNFIAVFVLFALGADHIFVSVDKWKNARIDAPDASIEEVAANALPDAASAVFLTTVTTAIAFFGTAICPVAPIKMFAVFCGLLISIDYLMCILLIFPAVCIYDRNLRSGGKKNYCMSCHCCNRAEAEAEDADADAEAGNETSRNKSLIRRILLGYYNILHRSRFVLLVLSLGAIAVCSWKASTLELPVTADVRILDEDNEFERNHQWRQELLSTALINGGGSDVHVAFGLTPADTGDIKNPEEWSQLVLDDNFDPSTEESQIYLRGFCPDLFSQDFASLPREGYECPMNKFDAWLKNQSIAEEPEDIYVGYCMEASGLPVPQVAFNQCIIAWSKDKDQMNVLSNNGKVEIILSKFRSLARYDSPHSVLEQEYNSIESWFNAQSRIAPSGVKNPIWCNYDFWWYDTNSQMLSTATGAAGIALIAAAIVILISSRSLVMTIFSVTTIGYVLTSVTAVLVAVGWTLGFLESICFAILIGVSVDFVIHFGYAYTKKKGDVSRGERTKYALIRMGPSVLAAAVTSISAGTVMLFTVITFFQKFALILCMTILQATLGSFVVFLVFTDTIGPSNPTYLADRIFGSCGSKSAAEDFPDETRPTNALSSPEPSIKDAAHTLAVTEGEA